MSFPGTEMAPEASTPEGSKSVGSTRPPFPLASISLRYQGGDCALWLPVMRSAIFSVLFFLSFLPIFVSICLFLGNTEVLNLGSYAWYFASCGRLALALSLLPVPYFSPWGSAVALLLPPSGMSGIHDELTLCVLGWGGDSGL